MIVKVPTSFTAPPMALVYDERHKVEGQFPASELPADVKRAVKGGGINSHGRNYTPPAFRDLLISIATTARPSMAIAAE